VLSKVDKDDMIALDVFRTLLLLFLVIVDAGLRLLYGVVIVFGNSLSDNILSQWTLVTNDRQQ
jgi:hypothetical protein